MKIQDAGELRKLILDGNVYNLERFVHGFRDRPDELAGLINDVRAQINCASASIPPAVVVNVGRSDQRPSLLVVLSIQLHSAQRAVQICSNPTLRTIVMGPCAKKVSGMLAPTLDDPAVVLKQASRLFSLPSSFAPPPLSQSTPVRSWTVF